MIIKQEHLPYSLEADMSMSIIMLPKMYLMVCLPPIQKADTITDTLKTIILTAGLDSIHICECYFISYECEQLLYMF